MSNTYYYAVCARTTNQILTTTSVGTVMGWVKQASIPTPFIFQKTIKIEDSDWITDGFNFLCWFICWS